MATLTSPSVLKQRVGTSRTYIWPLQRDLCLEPIEDDLDVVSMHYTAGTWQVVLSLSLSLCVCV